MIRIIATAICILFLFPQPASAGYEGRSDSTASPRMAYKIERKPGNSQGPLRIQIQGPKNMWGLRKFAAEADRQLGGVRIFKHGRCTDRPQALCVRVEVTSYGRTQWQGRAFVYPNSSLDRTIKLNTHYHHGRYQTAAHELTHVLGIRHHREAGTVGLPERVHFSRNELSLLRRTYPAR